MSAVDIDLGLEAIGHPGEPFGVGEHFPHRLDPVDELAGLSARNAGDGIQPHERAFSAFRGACTRGIYDNMKTAVDAIFIGGRYNHCFSEALQKMRPRQSSSAFVGQRRAGHSSIAMAAAMLDGTQRDRD